MDVFLGVLGVSSVKATIIAIGVMAALGALRVKSPAIRHRAWTCVLVAMLLLPALSLGTPGITLRIFPPAPAVPAISELQAPPKSIPAPVGLASDESTGGDRLDVPGQPLVRGPGSRLDLYRAVILLYVAGLGILLLRLLVGMALAMRLAREASRDGTLLHSPRCRAGAPQPGSACNRQPGQTGALSTPCLCQRAFHVHYPRLENRSWTHLYLVWRT